MFHRIFNGIVGKTCHDVYNHQNCDKIAYMRQNSDFTSVAVSETALRLGQRIRLARKLRQLTLSDLERICRIHRTTLGRLERGDAGVSLGIVLTVLEALGELADTELLLSQAGKPAHQRGMAVPLLEQDF